MREQYYIIRGKKDLRVSGVPSALLGFILDDVPVMTHFSHRLKYISSVNDVSCKN